MEVYLWTNAAFLKLSLHLSSLWFSIDNVKLCSCTSGASVLHLLWTFSIVTGSRSWICFFLSLLKGQGNMKPQKANSPVSHFCEPTGQHSSSIFNAFSSPPDFSIHSPWHNWWQLTQKEWCKSKCVTKLLLMNIGASEGVQHMCDEQGEDIMRLGLITGFLVLHGCNPQYSAHTCVVIIKL